MQRLILEPRSDWKKKVESKGLTFHSRDSPYWNEHACYVFSSREIDTLEHAANSVHEVCLEAAQHIIDNDLFGKLAIPQHCAELIKQSWKKNELHLYGRFDFIYNGQDEAPKMIEYNADTPTSLLEASVIQWYWLEERFPNKDQFNSLHESLIERWKEMNVDGRVHFSTLKGVEEDVMNVEYIRDTAHQAGLDTKYIDLQDIGYLANKKVFCDLENQDIRNLFKLYPWEWMLHEEFGRFVKDSQTRFIEPAWKMLWSNKGILPILWEIAPNHPNLLPAYYSKDKISDNYVQKPIYSREGANVLICTDGKIQETGGEYGEEGYIYQQYKSIRSFDGKYPVIGLWMIGDYCRGMGIRESDGLVTNNLSRFTPHFFEPTLTCQK